MKDSKIDFNEASASFDKTPVFLISVKMCGWDSLRWVRNFFSKVLISEVTT
jgi:hypothetical protein